MSMLLTAVTISFGLSMVAKLLADHLLTSRVALVGPFLGFQYATNPGVAFSIRLPGFLQPLMIAVALVALAVAARHAKTTWSRVAFGLIIGGALGNIADRLFDGVVTDFVQVGTFPIFNMADSCISVGVALLLIEGVVQWRKKD